MTEESKTAAEQGVRALHDFLSAYLHGHRHAWMHDIIGTEFDQGEAHALTGLALIPGVRTALDTIDEQLQRFAVKLPHATSGALGSLLPACAKQAIP